MHFSLKVAVSFHCLRLGGGGTIPGHISELFFRVIVKHSSEAEIVSKTVVLLFRMLI